MEIQISQVQNIPLVANALKVLLTGLSAFLLAFLLTPFWTHILYKYKVGIKIKEKSVDGDQLTFVNRLHASKAGTPTMGGVIVWVSVLIFSRLSQSGLIAILSPAWIFSAVPRYGCRFLRLRPLEFWGFLMII